MIILINQYPPFCIYYSTSKTNIDNNIYETPEMIALR